MASTSSTSPTWLTAIWVYNMEFENTLVVTVDRQKIYETTVGGEADMKAIDQLQDPAVDAINKRLKNIHFRTTAGPHEDRGDVPSAQLRRIRRSPAGARAGRRTGSHPERQPRSRCADRSRRRASPETPSRQRIFSCKPKSTAEQAPCAKQILTRLATEAFRRPAVDADVADLMAFYDDGQQERRIRRRHPASAERPAGRSGIPLPRRTRAE